MFLKVVRILPGPQCVGVNLIRRREGREGAKKVVVRAGGGSGCCEGLAWGQLLAIGWSQWRRFLLTVSGIKDQCGGNNENREYLESLILKSQLENNIQPTQTGRQTDLPHQQEWEKDMLVKSRDFSRIQQCKNL